MKKSIIILFLLFQASLFSQKHVSKMLQTDAGEINISTAGLDNVVLENSTSGFLEVYLYAEDYDDQIIKIEDLHNEVHVNFEFKGAQTREVVFRKFITKRLQRANAIIKIPQGKKIVVFGENVDIQSMSCANDIAIYIDNGIIKLNKVQANVVLKLYAGNVYATLRDKNIDVVSNLGKIKVNNVILKKEYQSKGKLFTNTFKINTIKGNIFLSAL